MGQEKSGMPLGAYSMLLRQTYLYTKNVLLPTNVGCKLTTSLCFHVQVVVLGSNFSFTPQWIKNNPVQVLNLLMQ